MPIKTTLLRESRVLLLRYTDPFNATETLANLDRLIREIYAPAKNPIHSISDFTALTQIRLTMLSDGIRILRRTIPNSGLMTLITSSPVANGIANTLAQVLINQNVFVYHSLDAAWSAIDALLAMENNATAK